MDVHCSTCNEPWNVHHLWHDAIHDAELSAEELATWQALPSAQKLSGSFRAKLQAAGWQFGRTLTNVMRCPCCPKDAAPNRERMELKAALEGLFGDDPDGLASVYEDHRL